MVAKKSFENTLLNTEQLIFKIRHRNINYRCGSAQYSKNICNIGVLFL